MDLGNSNFEIWLNEQAQLAMHKVTSGETLKPTEIMILVLRAQALATAQQQAVAMIAKLNLSA